MTVEKLTPEELHILQHALGLDQYGQGTWYRNHYVTPDGPSPARDRLKHMESLGLVWCYSLALLRADDTGWSVTELGKQVVREQSPPPPTGPPGASSATGPGSRWTAACRSGRG